MKSSARSALQNSTRLSRENAKLDQLSHFVQLAMGELQKKKEKRNEVEEKSEVADYTQFKVSNPSGVLGKVLFLGGMRTRRRKSCLHRRDSAPVGFPSPTVKRTSSRRESHRGCP